MLIPYSWRGGRYSPVDQRPVMKTLENSWLFARRHLTCRLFSDIQSICDAEKVSARHF